MSSALDSDVKRTDLGSNILRLLGNYQGIAIGDNHEDPHVIQCLTNNLKRLAKCGIRTIYVEMIPSRFVTAVQNFNKNGDTKKEFAIDPSNNEPFGRQEVACIDYALNVWHNKFSGIYPTIRHDYAAFLHEARKNDIEIVGIDGFEASRQRLKDSNPHWARVIADHHKLNPDEKFLILGGYLHFLPSADPDIKPVQELLDIAVPIIHHESQQCETQPGFNVCSKEIKGNNLPRIGFR